MNYLLFFTQKFVTENTNNCIGSFRCSQNDYDLNICYLCFPVAAGAKLFGVGKQTPPGPPTLILFHSLIQLPWLSRLPRLLLPANPIRLLSWLAQRRILIFYCHKWVGSGAVIWAPSPTLFKPIKVSSSNNVACKKNLIQTYESSVLHRGGTPRPLMNRLLLMLSIFQK